VTGNRYACHCLHPWRPSPSLPPGSPLAEAHQRGSVATYMWQLTPGTYTGTCTGTCKTGMMSKWVPLANTGNDSGNGSVDCNTIWSCHETVFLVHNCLHVWHTTSEDITGKKEDGVQCFKDKHPRYPRTKVLAFWCRGMHVERGTTEPYLRYFKNPNFQCCPNSALKHPWPPVHAFSWASRGRTLMSNHLALA